MRLDVYCCDGCAAFATPGARWPTLAGWSSFHIEAAEGRRGTRHYCPECQPLAQEARAGELARGQRASAILTVKASAHGHRTSATGGRSRR